MDLFSYRRVFVPVHVHGNHWCLGCVHVAERRIEYYDSLGGSNDTFFSTMRQYLADEYAAHHSGAAPLPADYWSCHCPANIPRQDNGSDCGVFTLKFADFLSHDTPLRPAAGGGSAAAALDFSAADMNYFRNRIALEIQLQRVM